MLTLPAEAACGDGVMDLVFVIDGSKSMGPANFELVKHFVISIVESLNVSRAGSHVGLLQYSTKVRREFTLSQHASAHGIRQAVARMQYMGRGSMTGSALRHMFQFSFSAKEGARPNIPHVSIVFTDGRSQDDVSEWANKAKNSGIAVLFLYFIGIGGFLTCSSLLFLGITIYAVGVGKAIEQELREIASEPDERHLYYAEDFKDMGEITNKLKSRMCTGSFCSTSSLLPWGFTSTCCYQEKIQIGRMRRNSCLSFLSQQTNRWMKTCVNVRMW